MGELHLFYTVFAATYNCGTYGSGSYNSAGECQTTTNPNGNNGDGNGTGTTAQQTGMNQNGSLSDTGLNVLLPIGAGILLVIVAIVLLVRVLKNRKNQTK